VSVNVAPGLRLNYRRSARKGASGTWSLLVADGKRGARMTRIAAANDYEAANGADVMDFSQAQKAALEMAQGRRPMPTARAKFSAADVARALLAAKAAGVAVRVEVTPDGKMNVIMLGASAQKESK
jgi:hypothetical protein